tara:strand:- start:210 stop:2132 length:1923 start_codon:yes stop_codon:yes gene_type:complete
MVIYSNNLHQKLQGVAISREYLKYNTPFCDIVDDPNFQIDFDLAIGYNSAINGNLSAADSFIKNLTLNSGILDWSTLDYYTKKTSNNPIFASSIREMQNRFNTPSFYDDSFQQSFNELLKDCLNSPCNLFLQTSDSIGRMAQATSTKNASNTFGVGALSGSFVNMIDDLDQTIFNKIPSLFQNAHVETVQVADKAWTNTQAILAGKKNLPELIKLAREGQSFRGTSNVYRYTPDVKSYNDYSAAGSLILNNIKGSLGGCFDKFQYNYRYNPYSNNTQFPSGDRVVHVNGRDILADGTGKIYRSTNNTKNLKGQTGNKSSLSKPTIIPESGNAFSDNTTAISKIYNLTSKGNGVQASYSIFGALIDKANKIFWYEDYSKTINDKYTLMGKGNAPMGDIYRICPSYEGSDLNLQRKALNGELTDEQINNLDSETLYTFAGVYARGWRHDLTDEGMETLYNTSDTKYINDGVAISLPLFESFINDPEVNPISTAYDALQRPNKFFIAARVPNGRWYFYKVVDKKQKEIVVDFTVGAYQHFMKANSKGTSPEYLGKTNEEEIKGTTWTRVKKTTHDNLGPLEIRICQGDIADVKERIKKMDLENNNLEKIEAGNTLLPRLHGSAKGGVSLETDEEGAENELPPG